MSFTRRMKILDALAFRIPCIANSQLLEFGPRSPSYERSLQRLLAGLERSRLIRQLQVIARPPPVIEGPLFSWRPGDAPPDFNALQYQAAQRNCRPVEVVTVYLGTDRLANILGGTCGQHLNRHAVSHDLGTAGAFTYLWKTDPNLALAWQGEKIIAPSRKQQKLPDAILYDAAGEPVLAIEFIGDYPASRIRDFHQDCVSRNLGYEFF